MSNLNEDREREIKKSVEKKDGDRVDGGDDENENEKENNNENDNDELHVSVGSDIISIFNVNEYTSTKSYVHALLNVSLITANANQLKHVLHAGSNSEFYYLLVSFIVCSILVQLLQCGLCVYLGYQVDIREKSHHARATTGTKVCIMLNILTVVLNIMINSFDDNKTDLVQIINSTSCQK